MLFVCPLIVRSNEPFQAFQILISVGTVSLSRLALAVANHWPFGLTATITDSTTLTDKDRQTLERVLPVYQQNPGKVRIVGYAGAGTGAVEQLDSYRTALDRAQAVASALTKAGIPSDKIHVEAAPHGQNSGESRAEVLLEP